MTEIWCRSSKCVWADVHGTCSKREMEITLIPFAIKGKTQMLPVCGSYHVELPGDQQLEGG
jgi:hypothetical protein